MIGHGKAGGSTAWATPRGGPGSVPGALRRRLLFLLPARRRRVRGRPIVRMVGQTSIGATRRATRGQRSVTRLLLLLRSFGPRIRILVRVRVGFRDLSEAGEVFGFDL